MKDEHEDLLRIATSVADGDAVDWDSEKQSDARLTRKLRHLRNLERIALAHRPPGVDPTEPLHVGAGPPDPHAAAAGTRTKVPDGAGPAAGPLPVTRWNSLHLVERIGGGSYGDVYRAYDPVLQKDVALKLIRANRQQDARSTRRFLDEARRLARVRHPNVLAVHGADVHDNRPGLWTDLVNGDTLEKLLERQGSFGPEEAAVIGVELCRALAAVHAAGLVHHDVKTSNIMRERGGRIVLMDFSSVTDRVRPRDLSRTDPAIGTPRFMAPERFVGRDSGVASDIYSVGVVLYRLVSRRFPIEASNFGELSDKHRRGEWVSLRDVRPDLPVAFVQAVERALDPDPQRRYATVGALEHELAAYLGLPVPVPDPKPSPWPRPLRRVLIGALAAVAVVTAGVFLFLLPGDFEVDVSLFRMHRGMEQRLKPGDTIASGDRLFMEVKGTREMNIYVMNEDARGEAHVLFPLSSHDLRNPLAPGEVHRLPGDMEGTDSFWEVTSVGGEEFFLVIASQAPLHEVEEEFAKVPQAAVGAPGLLTDRTIERLRGVGGIVREEPPEPGGKERSLTALSRSLSARAASETGIWIWEIQLRNPD